MVKHNNVIPNQHFKKKWQFHVKTWFNQPARKTRRRNARVAKAVKDFPRPTAGLLRPVVHGQTVRYNMKKRTGRGFTLEELKEAGIPKGAARSIGISVDYRRRNRCLESLQENATRLKAYKASLLIFPRRSSKPKSGDASKDELVSATQKQGPLFPIERDGMAQLETTTITDDMKSFGAYRQLRQERTNERLAGKRAKKAADMAAEEKDKAK